MSTLDGAPGSGDISSVHLGHSVLAISMATGEPSVRPWRMPPTRVISSASKRIRGPTPVAEPAPGQLVGDVGGLDRQPGGQALDDDDEGRPWDSPAVRKRSTRQRYRTAVRRRSRSTLRTWRVRSTQA